MRPPGCNTPAEPANHSTEGIAHISLWRRLTLSAKAGPLTCTAWWQGGPAETTSKAEATIAPGVATYARRTRTLPGVDDQPLSCPSCGRGNRRHEKGCELKAELLALERARDAELAGLAQEYTDHQQTIREDYRGRVQQLNEQHLAAVAALYLDA